MRRELHLNKAVNIIADALLTPYSIRQSLWFDWDVCDGMAVASHLDEQRRLTLTPEAGKRRTNSKGTFRKGQREECEGPLKCPPSRFCHHPPLLPLCTRALGDWLHVCGFNFHLPVGDSLCDDLGWDFAARERKLKYCWFKGLNKREVLGPFLFHIRVGVKRPDL